MPSTLYPSRPAALRCPDAITPAALIYWPFSALTPQQQVERHAMEVAARNGELRATPSSFVVAS